MLAKQNIKDAEIEKAESLRNLYLIQKLLEEIFQSSLPLVADSIDIKKALKTSDEQVKKLIPLVERELPRWMKHRAKQTFDTRSGFVTWDK